VNDPAAARILITGASRGLGRALAVELSRRGHQVLATARNLADLAELDATERIELDVTDPTSVDAAVKRAGEVGVLVNNAGTTVQAPVEAVPIDAVRAVLETNVYGPLRLIQALLPSMRERNGGLIINISSEAVRAAPALQGTYAASKAALEALSETLQKELEPFGVKVLVISAGGIRTEMRSRQQKYRSEPYQALIERYEAGMAEYEKHDGGSAPEEIAAQIADLIESPEPPRTAKVE
jgi:NAD(P)-dependent dehydrogenase (short-subunit alcohol dehydrogenase family)